jgi:hypothetical protein
MRFRRFVDYGVSSFHIASTFETIMAIENSPYLPGIYGEAEKSYQDVQYGLY